MALSAFGGVYLLEVLATKNGHYFPVNFDIFQDTCSKWIYDSS